MSVVFAYIGVILIWSTTPLAIQWSSEGWGYLFGAAARMVLGAVVCLLLLFVLKQKLVWHKQAVKTYMAASLGIYGAMLCVYWGSQYVHSGLVAVLFALNPIITSIMATIWLRESNFSVGRLFGTILGFVGVYIIFNSDLILSAATLKGIVAILCAVVLHSASSVWVKRIAAELPALSITSGSLLLVAPLYIVTWAIFGHTEFDSQFFMLKAGVALTYLSILGSVLGFSLYFYILQNIDASKVALVTLVTPVLALIFGSLLNDETISINVLIGALFIIIALVIHQWADILLRSYKTQAGNVSS